MGQNLGQEEPPSPYNNASLYRIGRDSQGHWVVQDQSGLHGGLFVNRAEALKFALFENGHRPQAIVMVPSWPMASGCMGTALAKSGTKSKVPNTRKSRNMPSMKPKSPMRLTMKAFLPASEADFFRK